MKLSARTTRERGAIVTNVLSARPGPGAAALDVVSERDFDKMMRQFRAAKWGTSAGQTPLHPRLRAFVARYPSLFALEEALLRAAVNLVRGMDSDIRWTAVIEWLHRYGVRRAIRTVGSGRGKRDLVDYYEDRQSRRRIDQRIAAVSQRLISELFLDAMAPADAPERIIGPRMNRDLASFRQAVTRALGDVLHGNDAQEEAVHILVIERILRPDVRWSDRELRVGERDNPAGDGREVLAAPERQAAHDYLADPSRQHVRDRMAQLIAFHQQDVEICPERVVHRWPAPPPYADDDSPRPRFGVGDRRLIDLQMAVDSLLSARPAEERMEVTRAIYDHSGEYVHYVRELSRALEGYRVSALPSTQAERNAGTLGPSAFDLSIGLERGLLRQGYPAVGDPSGRALAYLDVARSNILLGSGDPRTLQYGSRALEMLGIYERDADQSRKLDPEGFDQALRALRHNASFHRKHRHLNEARRVHRHMKEMLDAYLVGRDERYEVRNRAIQLVHVSAVPLINHRDTLWTGRPLRDDDFERIAQLCGETDGLLVRLEAFGQDDPEFGRAARVTVSSLRRRTVELAALAFASGHRRRWESQSRRIERVWSLIRHEQGNPQNDNLTRLLAVRAGMYLTIGARIWQSFEELDADAMKLQNTVSPNALIHQQLDELRQRKSVMKKRVR